jgi:hypothetical protein
MQQPVKQASTEQPTTQPPVKQPSRPISSVEAGMPPWLKAAMNGKSNNGTFAGRGGKQWNTR